MAILIKKESLLIITVVLYAVYFIIRTFIKKDNNGVMYNLIMIMIIAYFWALVSCTLLPILVPPVEIKNTNVNMNVLKIFEYKEMDVLLKNVVGNVILFMPLAYVLYFVIGKIPKMLHFLCASVLLSMLIELLQYLENISGLANYTESHIMYLLRRQRRENYIHGLYIIMVHFIMQNIMVNYKR